MAESKSIQKISNSESRSFYSSLFKIVTPIALQNLITAAVNSADVIMLSYVSQTSLAASSLAGQVQFVLMLFFVGMSSGLIMLTSQYWGKKDSSSIETLAGIAFKFSCTAGFLFFVAALFFPRFLMRIFTNEIQMIEEGSKYLRLVSPSYFFLSISQVYQAVLKSIERVKTVTAITFVSLGLNVLLNAALIFGWGPLPKMGIQGVALATSISRLVETACCITVGALIPEIKLNPAVILKKNSLLTHDFYKFSLPALGNEIVWGSAFAMYSVIMGHLGENIVAANSVVGVARNLASVLCFGMAYGGAILLGKEMGSGDLEKSRRDASRLWKSTVLAGFVGSLIILASYPIMIHVGHLNEDAVGILKWILPMNALSIFGSCVNCVLICGIFRAGGDSKTGFIIDSIAMWAVSVPIGLICAFVLRLPPVWVYIIMYLDEFEKMPVIIHHYRSGKWLKNITRNF